MRRTRRSLCRRLGIGVAVSLQGCWLSAVWGEAWRTRVWHGLRLPRRVCVCREGLEDAGRWVWLAYARGVSSWMCCVSLIFEDTSNTAAVLPPLLRCAFSIPLLVCATPLSFADVFPTFTQLSFPVPVTSRPPRRDLCYSVSPVVVSSVRTLCS